jgi:RNA polymerase sigma-32 factor
MAKQIQALAVVSDLDRYMAQIGKYPVLSREQETDLAKRWRDVGDVQAAHALVTANLRFVVKIANEYRGYGARILDLVQEGSIGLMMAVKKFDLEKGYRLITYAVFWIRSYIHSFLMSTARMIKIGSTLAHRKLFFKLRSLKGMLSAKGMTNRDQLLDIASERLEVNRNEVEEMDQHLTGRDASLDMTVAQTGTSLVELMPADQENQEDMIARLEVEAHRGAMIESALTELDEREREIVRKRYLTDEPVQLKDIGAQMGITKQRVAQIEHRALKKMKESLQDAA